MDDADPGTPDDAGGPNPDPDVGTALEIDPEELADLLDGDGTAPRLVDVRPRGAYARGHLPGSDNVPLGELPTRAEEFDGDERVICVCREGIASLQAARLLAAYEGVDRAESLAGGIEAWPGELATGASGSGGDGSRRDRAGERTGEGNGDEDGDRRPGGAGGTAPF